MQISYLSQDGTVIKSVAEKDLKTSMFAINEVGYYLHETTSDLGTGIPIELLREFIAKGIEANLLIVEPYISGDFYVTDTELVLPKNNRVESGLLSSDLSALANHPDPGFREMATITAYSPYSGVVPLSLAPEDSKFFVRRRNDGEIVFASNNQKVNYYDELYEARIRLSKNKSEAEINDKYDLTMTTGIWLERALPESEQGYKAAIPPAQYQSRVIDINPETGVPDAQTGYFEGANALWEQKRDKKQKQRKDRTDQELERLQVDDTLTLEQELQLIADYETIATGGVLANPSRRNRRRSRL